MTNMLYYTLYIRLKYHIFKNKNLSLSHLKLIFMHIPDSDSQPIRRSSGSSTEGRKFTGASQFVFGLYTVKTYLKLLLLNCHEGSNQQCVHFRLFRG